MRLTRLVGVILAGGRSTRMGGQDKALLPLAGKPLVAHQIERLKPQVTGLAISSNARPEQFKAFHLPVLPDVLAGFQGPLAGIHAGLRQYPDSFVLCVAVDIPGIPADLGQRLLDGIQDRIVAYPTDGQYHALALLFRPGAAAVVQQYLDRGMRKLGDFLAEHGTAVLFDRPQDRGLFCNLNTPEDLAAAERELSNS